MKDHRAKKQIIFVIMPWRKTNVPQKHTLVSWIIGLTFLILTHNVYSQLAITGRITDGGFVPINDALVEIIDVTDTTLVLSSLTNANGEYRVEFPGSPDSMLAGNDTSMNNGTVGNGLSSDILEEVVHAHLIEIGAPCPES